jgi:sRNA-binding carbon storage regulator CsrA
MLVIRRKATQRLFMVLEDGRRIEILVIDARDGHARLGIEANSGIKIYREEIAPWNLPPTSSPVPGVPEEQGVDGVASTGLRGVGQVPDVRFNAPDSGRGVSGEDQRRSQAD